MHKTQIRTCTVLWTIKIFGKVLTHGFFKGNILRA